MTELLPLFPLGTVLFPGVLLPLHIFEERYRELVRDLVSGSERRWFGVVAIKSGTEVGDDTPELYDVGCVAVVRRVDAYPDGRYDVVAAGGPRFLIETLDESRSYLRASVSLLGEEEGTDAAPARLAAWAALTAYSEALSAARGAVVDIPAGAEDPLQLSYLAASILQVDLAEKQALLECGTAVERMAAATRLLRRESGLLRHFAAVPPGADLTAGPVSLN